jgi:hypothetical protein
VTRYRCGDAQKADGYEVTAACEVVGVSTSAYYDWTAKRVQGPSEREQRDTRLLAEIRAIHRKHRDYGEPRMTQDLARRGMPTNHKKVEAMMAVHGIVARRHRRRRNLTKPDKNVPAIPDLVGRLFDPDDVDHTWGR